MKDYQKILLIILIVIGVYLLYLYFDDIKEALLSPFDGEKSNGESVVDSILEGDKNGENVKVVVVEEEDATIKVVEKASPAVVSVVRSGVFFDPFRGPFRSEDSIGTGFIIDGKEGIVLTNRHVVDSDEVSYSVVLGAGEKNFNVLNVYRDPVNDFAILKIDTQGETLPELTLGDSDNIKVGQTVIAIGNALGQFGNSATKGIVSGLGRGIIASSGPFSPAESIENVIQTDAALNPGNSGGPLLNLQAEVVGINVAISQGAENIGFSIPVNSVKNVIAQFYEQGKISRPYLGVEYAQITQEIAQERDMPMGAFVKRVVPDSPASKAGLEAGDIVIRINGIRLDDEDNTLAKVIARQPVDKDIEIVVDRNGKEITLKTSLKDLEE